MPGTLRGADAPGGDPPCWAHLGDGQMYGQVRDDVAGRKPVDERERRSIEQFLEHYDRLVAPFDEDASPVHVTGSAVIVGERGIVLHLHRRLGTWIQPGGHIDAGETPWQAALREGGEETGLPLRLAPIDPVLRRPPLLHVDVHPGPRGHTHLDLRYLCSAPPSAPSPPPEESQDVEWVELDAAIDRTTDGLRGLLRWMRDERVAEAAH